MVETPDFPMENSVAPHDDGALLFRAKNGESDAVSELLARYTPLVIKLSHSILGVPKSEEDDLRQEGLIALHKAIRLYDPAVSSFSTFAYLCVRRGMLSFLKKYSQLAPTVPIDSLENTPGADTANPELQLIDRESCDALLRQFDAILSDFESAVLKLHLSGKTPRESAKILEKSEKSVTNALARSRKKLSTLLS